MTDEWGHKAVQDVVNHFDYHATLLHLFGINHNDLTFVRSNRDQTLTDGQPGKLVEGLLARIGRRRTSLLRFKYEPTSTNRPARKG